MKWSDEDMAQAIDHARRYKNVKGAAKKYSIPATTLREHLTANGNVKKLSHPTALSSQEENEIVETCLLFAEWGFGLCRSDINGIIQSFLKFGKKPNPFRDGVPGEGWWSAFMKCHPNLANRRPQHLQLVRAKALNPEIVQLWFNECLGPVLANLDISAKPDHIYNVDESDFQLSWTPKCILTRRGHKTPQALLAGSVRENITVQLCMSASGNLLPPLCCLQGRATYV